MAGVLYITSTHVCFWSLIDVIKIPMVEIKALRMVRA